MKNIETLVRERRSVRTFKAGSLSEQDKEKLCAFMNTVENPYSLPVKFKMLNGMNCPVVVGTELYVGGKMKKAPHMNEAFGYSFEKIVLYAQSLGIGTVWIGGTMNRGNFEKAMGLEADEVMPCVSPVGYPAKKMSLRETMMRKGVKADERMAFEELFFSESYGQPLTKEKAGKLYLPLELVRLAPSTVNRQPWRVVVKGDGVHFFLQRSKGFGGGEIDMQKIDLGIALCHFDLAVNELGIPMKFALKAPGLEDRDGMEYIASYLF